MTTATSKAPIHSWLTEPLSGDIEAALSCLAESPGVARIAVMPDVHLSRDVCVGTVLATTDTLYPRAVGGDIGCGMLALRFDCMADLLADAQSAAELLAALYERVPVNRHGPMTVPESIPAALLERPLSSARLEAMKHRDARVQMGTLGRGNHFLELQADRDGKLWLMLHSGSRAMGPAIRDHHLQQATIASSGMAYLTSDSVEGQAYLTDMSWARDYARANRGAMMEAVIATMTDRFGVTPDRASLIEIDHNHVRTETHEGQTLWVHRKGALPAHEGRMGIIPGSMGSNSYHTLGRGNPRALCSSSHGAGRTKSRTEARKTITVSRLEHELAGVWFDHRAAHRLVDEAPSAYKNIQSVMRAQRVLTRITNELRPILSYKGG